MNYIHWGTDKFEAKKFKPVWNCRILNKPIGGFWACEEHSLQWNQSEYCYVKQDRADLDKCVTFRFKETASLLLIDSLQTVQELCRNYPVQADSMFAEICRTDSFIDWHRLAEQYDAVIFRNIETYSRQCNGIDLESVCVFKPESIIIL